MARTCRHVALLMTLVVGLGGCSASTSPPTAPPADFIRNELAPLPPSEGPIPPVVVELGELLPAPPPARPPRRDIGRLEGPLSEDEILRLQRAAEGIPSNPALVAVAVAEAAGGRQHNPGPAFEALDFVTAGSNFVPPDPELAVGPGHVIAVANDSFAVYSPVGVVLAGPVSFSVFFAGTPGCVNLFDPNVVYDEELDRFVLGIDANGSGYCVAMSLTPDPTQPWASYSFATVPPAPPGTLDFFDYPHAGVGEDAIFVGANVFDSTGATFLRAEVWALDKQAMALGAPLPMPLVKSVSGGFTPQPMNAHGWLQASWPSSGSHTVVANQYLPSYSPDLVDVWAWSDPFGVNAFTLVGTVDLAVATGAVGAYPVDAPQLAGANLQANDWRLLDAEYRNGSVWLTQTIACNPGLAAVDCVRWAELDPTLPVVVQAGVITSPDEHRIFPDLAVNHCDDMLIGYTRTSSSTIPAVWVTGRLGSDPPGTVGPELPLRLGDIPYASWDGPPHRWGDYAGGTSGPDGVTTWYLGEYAKGIGAMANWGTFAGSYTTPCATQGDVHVAKSSGHSPVVPGTAVSYTVVVGNAGPADLTQVLVSDVFAATLGAISWSCVGAAGPPAASCSVGAGSGDVQLSADLAAGAAVTVIVSATLSASATGTLVNTATAAAPMGLDPNPGNDWATVADSITPLADLGVAVDDGVAAVLPGATVTYTVTVVNAGPSDAPASTVADTVPAELVVNGWSCAGGGCGAASGVGPLSDSPSLPAGGSVVYTVAATVAVGATQAVVYTVAVGVGPGVTDPDPSDNLGSDSDRLDLPIFCDGFEDGSGGAWSGFTAR